jgi:CheY-like chemotaxis protein
MVPSEPPADPPSLAGLCILVIDDNGDSREVLQHVLSFAGATVTIAASAEQALAALEGVHVVITDYSMPGATGLWVLEEVRKRPRPVPVVLLTGFADTHAREFAAAGFARVVRKPVDLWALCGLIAEVARHHMSGEGGPA